MSKSFAWGDSIQVRTVSPVLKASETGISTMLLIRTVTFVPQNLVRDIPSLSFYRHPSRFLKASTRGRSNMLGTFSVVYQGGAISETSESSSHGSECPSLRVVHKAALELLPRQLEVLQP